MIAGGNLYLSVLVSLVGRAMPIAAIPIIAWLYDPGTVGLWPLVTVLSGLLAAPAILRLDIPVTLARYTPESRTLLLTGLCLAVASALALLLLVLLARPTLARWIGLSHQPDLLLLTPLHLFMSVATTMLAGWLMRAKALVSLSLAIAVNPLVTTVALAVLPLLLGGGAAAFIGSYLLGAAAGLMTAGYGASMTAAFARPRVLTARSIRTVLVRFRAYPQNSVPYAVLNTVHERAVQAWFAVAYGVAALGVFYMMRQLVMVPVNAVLAPVRQNIFAHLAEQSDTAERRRYLTPFMQVAGVVVGIALAWSFVLLGPAIGVLVGERWARAGIYAPWAALAIVIIVPSSMVDRVFDVVRRPHLALVAQGIVTGMALLVILLAWWRGLGDLAFVRALGLADAASNIAFLVLGLALLGYRSSEMLRLFAPGGAAAMASAVLNLVLAALLPPLAAAAAGLLLGGAAILWTAWRTLPRA
jgi:O-antigen/teichoic acid export membrane protein